MAETTSTATTVTKGGINTFDSLFTLYSKFGDPKSEGRSITLSNSDKWMKAAGVVVSSLPVNRPNAVKGKANENNNNMPISLTFTLTDTGIEFKKVAKTRKALDKKPYQDFLEALIRRKLMAVGTPESEISDERLEDLRLALQEKMVKAGPPSVSSASTGPASSSTMSSSSSSDVIARLTDHTKYTGSHKLRFDPETGKGRGKAGRV